ncbi:MAG: hypothetical protein GC200_05585 [Tepidisphaera sp.]|nr:hypothetical protein [Tepidisphaera sp.]
MIHRRAYAKINLMLSVGPPLPPGASHAGYHPIASWFAPISLWDDVEVTRGAPSVSIEWASDAPRPTPIDWPPEKDLAVRALRALEAHAGRTLDAKLVVRKRIPVGGGLGGGSSDAAAALLAVRNAFALDIDDAALGAIAARLGSDVSYFLDTERDGPEQAPRPAFVEGLGEHIERSPRRRGRLVLVVPEFGCATGPVYKAFDELVLESDRVRLSAWQVERFARERDGIGPGTPPTPHRVRPELVRERAGKMQTALQSRLLFNDLAKAAFKVEPRLGTLVTALKRITREDAHVTGSGSCVFLLDHDGKIRERVERARGALEEQVGPLAVLGVDLA